MKSVMAAVRFRLAAKAADEISGEFRSTERGVAWARACLWVGRQVTVEVRSLVSAQAREEEEA